MLIDDLKNYNFKEIEDDLEKFTQLCPKTMKSNIEKIRYSLKLFYIFLLIHYDFSPKNESFYSVIINKRFLDKQIPLFFCFIYEHCHFTFIKKYHSCYYFKKLLESIPNTYSLENIEINTNKISSYIKKNIPNYKKLNFNQDLLEFYIGWEITTLDGIKLSINLSDIYCKFGKEFCRKYHFVVKRIASTTIKSTTTRLITDIYTLNRFLCNNYNDIEDVNFNLNSYNTHKTFHYLYNLLLIENLENNYSLVYFHLRWNDLVRNYQVLTEHDLFEKPIIPILIPKFKSSKSVSHHKINSGAVVNDKLIFNIPLHYTDNVAKELIFQRLQNDVEYIVNVCTIIAQNIKNDYQKFYDAVSIGSVIEHVNLRKNCLGPNNVNNVCATYHHLYTTQTDKELKAKKLGFKSVDELIKFIPNLTQIELYPFLVLLINEHPQITESWLTEWQLYKNDKIYGYVQEDNNYYIVSLKKRKQTKALQKILLNERSKKIVEDIIWITSLNRNYLKSIKNPNYKYMLLENIGIFSSPKKINKFYNPSTKSTTGLFLRLFKNKNYLKLHHSPREALELFYNFSLTKFRATCAVQVYLQTNSIQKMSVALGHENLDHRLINSYLPSPLWDYFTERWIRIYQNSLMYEAMKDSVNLFNALDIKQEELDEFIKNHHFGELPEYIKEGKFRSQETSINCERLGVFSISIPLLQWFIAIIEFINKTSLHLNINYLAYKWYECAVLVISQIELSINQEKTNGFAMYLDNEIIDMYKLAKEHPLQKDLVERILTC